MPPMKSPRETLAWAIGRLDPVDAWCLQVEIAAMHYVKTHPEPAKTGRSAIEQAFDWASEAIPCPDLAGERSLKLE